MAYVTLDGKSWELEDFLDGNHVTSFPEVIEAVANVTEAAHTAGSTSSLPIGNGSKVFVTDKRVPWVLNTPIRAMDTAVSGKYMSGLITAITNSDLFSTVTINVTQNGGSGTHASWNLIVCPERTTITASSPAIETEGGWGSDNFAAGRKNAQVARQIDVIGVCAAPPASASIGDNILVAAGFGAALSGDFVGKAGQIAKKLTSTPTFSYSTPVIGDLAFDKGSIGTNERSGGSVKAFYTYTSGTEFNSIGASGGSWIYNSDPSPASRKDYLVLTSNTTLDYTYHNKIICVRTTSDITLTLAHTPNTAYKGTSFVIVNDNSDGHTVIISGIMQKNNAGDAYLSSVTLYPGQTMIVFGTNESGSTMNYVGIKTADLENAQYQFKGLMIYNSDGFDLLTGVTDEVEFDSEVYDTLGSFTSGSIFTIPAGITKCQVSLQVTGVTDACSGYFKLKNLTDSGQVGVFDFGYNYAATSTVRLSAISGWMLVTPGDQFVIEAHNNGPNNLEDLNFVVSAIFEH
jgi:hypothetical protein